MLHRKGWWTGDVWRTALALKRFRPGLTMTAIDAKPTGLLIVSGLEPENTVLLDRLTILKEKCGVGTLMQWASARYSTSSL
jgi:hypothetical protein